MVGRILLPLQLYVVMVLCYIKPETPCAMDDNQCLTKVFADLWAMAIAGNPKAGIATLDPMHHVVINIGQTLSQHLMSVQFTLRDVTVTGFKDSQVLLGGISHPKPVYGIVLLPHYEMRGKYQCDGNFLDTPIKGNGNFTLKGSAAALKLINDNDKILSIVWGPPVTTANLNKILGNLNKFLVYVYALDNVQYVVKDIME